MKLEWEVQSSLPEGALVQALEGLWTRDAERSPFAAPALLRHLAAEGSVPAQRLALAYGRAADGQLLAWLPLYLHKDGGLRLLQYRGSDQSSILCAPHVPANAIGGGFQAVMAVLKPRSLYFDRVPPGSKLLEGLREALRGSAWRSEVFEATTNPCLRFSREEGGSAALLQSMRSHKKFDYFERRLRKEPGYAFEAMEGSEGLVEWVSEFCDAHDWSWSTSDTPSVYREPKARAELLGRLRAWAEQGVLLRFSIRVADGRPAFAICLLAPDRVVYHHVTISPAYSKHSAGHVLLRQIAEWMAHRDLCSLDFGVGHEDYKQRYANTVDMLYRVYGAASAMALPLIRGRVDAGIRARPRWHRLWDRAVNGAIRGRLVQRLRRLQQRLHTLRVVHLGEPVATRIALFRERYQGVEYVYFHGVGRGEVPESKVQVLGVFEVLCMLRREQGLPDAGRAGYYRMRSEGGIPYGVVEGGEVVQVCWIGPDRWEGVPAEVGRRTGRLWCIRKCVTARAARGRGLYSKVLSDMLARLPSDDEVIIYTQPWNVASQRGILRGGFRKIGMMRVPPGPGDNEKPEFLLDANIN